MTRLGRFFRTAFGGAVAACLVLACWVLWSGGLFDSDIAGQVRSASVYADEGVGLDLPAAEGVVGNRRLVVVMLAREDTADMSAVCKDVGRAAAGNLVVILRPAVDGFDTYPCALFPGADDENFGKAFVAETLIVEGLDSFVDEPLDAVKVMAVNYDQLVRSGTVPDGARTISPSFPRFLLAGVMVGTVIIGSIILYLLSRRAGRDAARRREVREQRADGRSALNGQIAELAQQIIEIDRLYPGSDLAKVGRTSGKSRSARKSRTLSPAKSRSVAKVSPTTRVDLALSEYRAIAAEYTELMLSIVAADSKGMTEGQIAARSEQVVKLSRRCRPLAPGATKAAR